jgi:hypothetical protein
MMQKPKSVDLKAEGVRAALIALYEAHEGMLPPASVVEAARDPSSPLHDEFEWDDDAAAASYRLAQAGALIRRIKLQVIRMDPTTKTVKATVTRQFQSRPSQRNADGGYETVDDIMRDADKRAELLAQVVREMTSYRKRYAELTELESVWEAIDEARAELEIAPSAAASELRPDAPAGA